MLIEVSGICQHCAESVKIILYNGLPISDCSACGKSPYTTRLLKGLIYVVSNPNQTGVKVGMTTKTIEERVKALSSTGVPGTFERIAIFPSDNPLSDEKKVHEKLSRSRIVKEHFDLDPVDAVLGAFRALKRRPIFFDKNLEKTFDLKLAAAKIKMQLRLSGVSG